MSDTDYNVQSYQDDFDTDQTKSDPLMNELNDDPVELLGVPADKLRIELDRNDPDAIDLDDPDLADDAREELES